MSEQNMLEFVKFVALAKIFINDIKSGEKVASVRFFPTKYKDLDGQQKTDKEAEFFQGMGKSAAYEIEAFLPDARVYEVDSRTKRAMLLTTLPKDPELLKSIRLPYRNIFLSVSIDETDVEMGYGKKVVGMLIHEQEVIRDEVIFYVYFIFEQETGYSLEYFKISFGDTKENISYASGTQKLRRILKQFIVNTVLFITDPEIEIVVLHRSEKNRERRERDGKIPLPSSNIIKLTGKIKRYFDAHGHMFDGTGYSHRFDVMGHWRHFKSDFYTRLHSTPTAELEKEGYRLRHGFVAKWIPPYEKGEGVKLQKTYSLEKPLEKDEIDLDAIKPLDKPLRAIKDAEWRKKQKEKQNDKNDEG